ncbi:MAG: hypothetical protein ACYDD2_14575 [Candidatus Acidiferrales bacterium]
MPCLTFLWQAARNISWFARPAGNVLPDKTNQPLSTEIEKKLLLAGLADHLLSASTWIANGYACALQPVSANAKSRTRAPCPSCPGSLRGCVALRRPCVGCHCSYEAWHWPYEGWRQPYALASVRY